MKRAELDFDRPQALQAGGPPERRGLERDEVRLLVTTERGHEHARFRDLPRFLVPGTLLVVNTSATLPASLPARHPALGPLLANVSTRYGGGLYLVELRDSAAEPGPLPVEAGDHLE
ncbi:MAG TPA: S-adenosylmethionine:tRNA ribosyltransferase-isomerase, partial [Thermoanaerobaculia bacterium]|nr:S-adenosylmethionine:tRNA ribosyltransferase-isomerase [Thermoanaerobaculia bacterium]